MTDMLIVCNNVISWRLWWILGLHDWKKDSITFS